jgi:hypothetical protein
MSETERQTRLYGEWYIGNSAVYDFDKEKHCEVPPGYTPGWRHVGAVDPAMSGKTGVTVWCEDPRTGIWYCVEAKYVENVLSPREVVMQVENIFQPFNITRRICDTHETWYIGTAAEYGYHYGTVYKKHERKKELIKNLQKALSDGCIKVSPSASKLISELTTCQYREGTDDKIVNASSYHLLDTAQYFVDNIPKHALVQDNEPLTLASFEKRLRRLNKEKKQRESKRLRMKRKRR